MLSPSFHSKTQIVSLAWDEDTGEAWVGLRHPQPVYVLKAADLNHQVVGLLCLPQVGNGSTLRPVSRELLLLGSRTLDPTWGLPIAVRTRLPRHPQAGPPVRACCRAVWL